MKEIYDLEYKTAVEKHRKLWLDALRGVAMILVVYGHCVRNWDVYFLFTSPVKMPLFFIISSYLFNPRSGEQGKFFKNLFFKLVVPWMVLGMFPYIHPVERFIDLISGKKLWFMPCLVIAETLWFYIRKSSKKTMVVASLGMLASILGLVMSKLHICRFAMIDTAFVVQAFFVMGFLLKEYEERLSVCWKQIVYPSTAVYCAMGGGYFTALYRLHDRHSPQSIF